MASSVRVSTTCAEARALYAYTHTHTHTCTTQHTHKHTHTHSHTHLQGVPPVAAQKLWAKMSADITTGGSGAFQEPMEQVGVEIGPEGGVSEWVLGTHSIQGAGEGG